MVKNYLKVASRSLLKNKGFTALNILGLAIGLASAALILIWVNFERSYDRFHKKGEQLFVAMNRGVLNNELQCWERTPKPLGPALLADFPDVEKITRFNQTAFLFTVDENKASIPGAFVDGSFLTMFDFPLLAGDVHSALSNMHAIVVTESFATRMFGKTDVVGKTVKVDSVDYATVTGVLKDLPKNTRFHFDYLLPWSYMEKLGQGDDNWKNNSIITYVELSKKARAERVNASIRDITIENSKGDTKNEVFLHSFPDWWLYSNFKNGKVSGGRIELVRLFTLISFFILLIACINFMNLSTARSEKRAKEVGVRKVMGALKRSLIGQFLIESIILSFLSGTIALFLVFLSLPAFGKLVNIPLSIDYFNWRFWLSGLTIILLTGFVAGSYPAFFLSSFKPIRVLKGTFKNENQAFNPRKFLVVFQFSIAIILMVCTFIVKQQIQHSQDRENGYDKQNLVYLFLSGESGKNFSLIKRALLDQGIASSVTRTASPITSVWSSGFPDWKGKAADDNNVFFRFNADETLVKTFGLQLIKGRDLDLTTYPTDSSAALINEEALQKMGFEDPIGQIIRDEGKEWHIVGVVKNFVMTSPTEKINPVVMYGAASWFRVMHIRFNQQIGTREALTKTEQIFKEYNPSEPFYPSFIDAEYASKFKAMQQVGNIACLFTLLTILISCLGIFGLAAYMAENRTKEISIRKVLGASIISLLNLLSKEFLLLMGISCFIAFPISYWAMNKWLESFDYRTTIQGWLFAAIAFCMMLITLVTVGSQAIKAALANPTNTLRDE